MGKKNNQFFIKKRKDDVLYFTYQNRTFYYEFNYGPSQTLLSDKFPARPNTLIAKNSYKGVNYFIYTDNKHRLWISNKVKDYLNFKQIFSIFTLLSTFVGLGWISNNAAIWADASIQSGGVTLAKILCPLSFLGIKRFAIFFISKKSVLKLNKIHNPVDIVFSNGCSMVLNARRNKGKVLNYIAFIKTAEFVFCARTKARSGSLVISKIPFDEFYKWTTSIKLLVARVIASFYVSENVILMFEKNAAQAQESAFTVFKYLATSTNKRVYYVLDSCSPEHTEIKKQFGMRILDKHSIRHFYYVIASKIFISSELSQHAANAMLYNTFLRDLVSKKPLIFLQHGIMFAKPVDNPAASGFQKNNDNANIVKFIASSDLEIEQIEKLGYNKTEIIKCGLPKFDHSYMQHDANKVVFMPTYRYWEMAKMLDKNSAITTSYVSLFAKVLKIFEENSMLDRLIITAHPSNMQVLREIFSNNEQVFETNISNALSQARIFITDFSSASYDAHMRGANIIYYWEEREYLIKKYKATPPINYGNCDGRCVYSVADLMCEVKWLMKNNYHEYDIYKDRYAKINEFNDRRNTERLVNILLEERII